MTHPITVTRQANATRIRMDDGKVNVMNPAMLSALHAAFDQAAADGDVAVLEGRDNIFSAGFDLKVFASGDGAASREMLYLGATLALKLLSFPRPVVTVTAGHAYPMGAFLMLGADWRIGADAGWRGGLNEVQIGLTIPSFALEMARQRLTPAHFSRTAMTAELFEPQEALTAGLVDQLVPREDLEAATQAAITRMAGLDRAAHAATKLRARAGAIAAVKAAIEAELT
ncbi:enoyl-CoA hydratase [Caulobacter ginsengisoli]|uniref:Enoyl-CoA hydratase n=1 Tax=Caulobacter ginsengisoli TaxID=400775 RepID=A0ABU0ISJ9_9CAUL|nr:crotonase/enoyl-CoA hydratase family protein [Caulobacter ginsengisoli]MDQ0464128.1 enoyl-CoA hydratase [Caulobacter ginsengisoli]